MAKIEARQELVEIRSGSEIKVETRWVVYYDGRAMGAFASKREAEAEAESMRERDRDWARRHARGEAEDAEYISKFGYDRFLERVAEHRRR